MPTDSDFFVSPQSIGLPRRLQRAAHFISYGVDRGLPEPFTISIGSACTSVGFRALEQLADWSLWFEASITEAVFGPTGGMVMRESLVDGFRLWCIGQVDA